LIKVSNDVTATSSILLISAPYRTEVSELSDLAFTFITTIMTTEEMPAFAVAIVGKQNEPLFIYAEEESAVEALYLQTVMHASIDIIDEKRRRLATTPATGDTYLGQLLSISDFKTFGSHSHTSIKVIVVCDTSTSEAGAIRDLIGAIQGLYTQSAMNPFQGTGSIITSRIFQQRVIQLVQVSNAPFCALLF
jgi:Sedlin, N-terminal conserved region